MECDKRRADKCDRHEKIFILTLMLYIIVTIIGTLLYMVLFDLDWFDALYGATLILTSIDVEYKPITTGQKLFVIIYSIVAVVILLSFVGSASDYFFDVLFVKQ